MLGIRPNVYSVTHDRHYIFPGAFGLHLNHNDVSSKAIEVSNNEDTTEKGREHDLWSA